MDQLKKMANRWRQKPGLVLGWAIAVYTLIFSLIASWKYFNFGYNALDLAIINQVFYNSSLGNFFASSIHPSSYLGDHFTPFLFILLPFYSLAKSPLTLLLGQTVILGLSAWPLYLIARKIINNHWGLLIASAWLLNPFVQNVNLFEFSFLPFAGFFIFWAVYCYQTGRFWPAVLFTSLALLVREDVALVIFMLGLIILLEREKFGPRTKVWLKWWLTLTILSVVYFIAALKFSSNFAVAGQYKFLLYYAWLGNSWTEIIKNIIFHPWWLLPRIFNLGSIVVALALMLPNAFLSLAKPKYLLLSGLIYLQLILGSGGQSLGTVLFTQYSLLLLPGVFLAAIFGLEKILRPKPSGQISRWLESTKPLGLVFLLAAIFYSLLFLGPLPGSRQAISQQGLVASRTKIKQAALELIPAQSAVAASYELLTPLSSRQQIASLNYVFLGQQQFLFSDYRLPEPTEYLAVDFQDLITYQLQYANNPFYQTTYQAAKKTWPEIFEGFGLIYLQDTVAVYQRGAENKLVPVKILTNEPPIENQLNYPLADQITLLGYNRQEKNHWQLFWQAERPIIKDYQLLIEIETSGQKIYQKIYPLAYGLWPTSRWASGQIIQTDYWFEFEPKITALNPELKISLVDISAKKNNGLQLNALRSTFDAITDYDRLAPSVALGQISPP